MTFTIKDLVTEVNAKKKSKVRPKKAKGAMEGELKKADSWKLFLKATDALKKHLDMDKSKELDKCVKSLRPSMALKI